METIYSDGTYLNKNPTWHEEDSSWKAGQIFRILKNNNVKLSTICEVGCGGGGIIKCLSEDYVSEAKLSGYEISAQAFEICKKKEGGNVSFFLKDVFEEKETFFDVIMAIDVFEHIEDYFGFLRKLRKKGEHKVFHIPLDLSVQTVLRSTPILAGRESVGHIHYFTKETALATLRDAGYEIVDYFYTAGSVDLPSRNWKVWLLKLPRRLFFKIHQDFSVRVLGGYSLLVLAK